MRDVFTQEYDRALFGPGNAGQEVEHGGLAGPVRADDPERLPLLEGGAQVVHHCHPTVGLGEVLSFEYDGHRSTACDDDRVKARFLVSC
jgi:hypothetical protein